MKIQSILRGLLITTACTLFVPHVSFAESRDEDNGARWARQKERATINQRRQVETRKTRQRKVRRVRRASPGFFETIFGAPRRRSARSDGWYGTSDRQQPRAAPSAPARPTFAAYQPDPLVALAVAGLDGDVKTEGLARNIHSELSTPNEPILRVVRDERNAIIEFYKDRKFAPAWVVDGYGVSVRGLRVLDVLSKAATEGLEPEVYLPPSMTSFGDTERFKDNPAALARLDIELTVKAVKFARHAYSGRIKPRRLSSTLDVAPAVMPPEKIISELMSTVHPEVFLDGLHPTHPVFAQMKEELGRIDKSARQTTSLPDVPPGSSIRVGQVDQRVPLLRQHMEQLGFLAADPAPVPQSAPSAEDITAGAVSQPGTEDKDTTLYSQDLADAVREFQSSKNLGADGIVGRRTLNALNDKAPENRVAKLKANMERMRWLPKNLGYKHVFVNQAAYQVRVVENGNVIHQARVVVGKQRFPTPIFSDEMETVVFNPYWNVPRSITRNEFLPKLWDDPGYLDRNGYEVINQRGQKVSSYSVDWWNYSGNDIPYDVRQTPGSRNALGEVKFLFPNKHSVYLHDTPSKSLFKKTTRAFSHGCVRVQDPRKFAEVILNWNTSQVNSAIGGGTNHAVRLDKKLPVHLTYFTVWPDDNGQLRYRSDVYGRDTAVTNALKRYRVVSR